MAEVERLALEHRPKLIVAGWSAYSRQLDFAEFRRIADLVGAYLMVDMAHFAGLVAAGLHPNPVPHAHVVTTTTHKTLGGPRGGVILTNDAAIAKKINSAVFPGQQGGPLEHVIAAKAVAFKLAAEPEFRERQERTLRGARIIAERLLADDVAAAGISVVSGGTDVHLVLVDLRDSDLDGQQGEDRLHRIGITVNRNAVPVRPAPADGLLRTADRHPRPGHPRLRRRRLPEVADIIAGRPDSADFDDEVASACCASRGHRPRRDVTRSTRTSTTAADDRLMAEAAAGAPGLPLAQPRAEALVRRRDRRRRRPRPGHRLLPGQEPRHHQHRRPGTGLAGRRQHGPQHRDHPLQLPVGRVRGDLRALAEAVGEPARGAGVRLPVQPARRDEPRPHPAATSASRVRRVSANKLNGIDAEWLDPQQVKELCPIINISDNIRYPVLGATFQPRAGIAKHDHVAWAFARKCDELGVDLIQNCEVTGFVKDGNRVVGVETSRGRIATEKVGLSRGRALQRAGRSWPGSSCRSSPIRCRHWSPSCTSRCTRPW